MLVTPLFGRLVLAALLGYLIGRCSCQSDGDSGSSGSSDESEAPADRSAAEEVVSQRVARKRATPKRAAPKRAAGKRAATKRNAQSARRQPAVGKPDDLKRIEGIGPKIAGLLEAAGITTFAALAKTPVARLQSILDEAGSRYRMHDATTWTEQAELAAAGRTEEFKKLKARLKRGRRA